MKKTSYKNSIQLDLSSTRVNLIPIYDHSSNSASREKEVIDLVGEMIRLVSKRGRVKILNEEVFDEVA